MIKGQIHRGGGWPIGTFEFSDGKLTVQRQDYHVQQMAKELTEKGIGHRTGGQLDDGMLWDGWDYMPLRGDDDFDSVEHEFRKYGYELKVGERS